MHKVRIHPRYFDMDTFGHVNNARYLTYYEEARVSLMNELVGWSYDWSKKGVILARVEVDFKNPVFFRDEIYVYIHCSAVGTKSFTLDYKMVRIKDSKEEIVSTCRSVMVMYDYETQKSVAVPEEWRRKLLKNKN